MNDPHISAKAEQVQAEAATLPSLDDIRELADRAVAHGGAQGMSMDEIRDIANRSVGLAEEVAVLLRRLSELLAMPAPSTGGES